MKRFPLSRLPLFTVIFLLACAASAAEKLSKVPPEFVGKWCGGDLETRLEIKANAIEFYESRGPIKAITRNGDELALTARLSGEGETWTHNVKFLLSKDKKQLSVPNADPPLVRRRCAK